MRRNPLTFDNRISLTPELRKSIRAARSRVAASLVSPAKHRAIEEATANSPHNFRVVLSPLTGRFSYADVASAERVKNAVTLLFPMSPDDVFEVESANERRTKAGRLSILTAFSYLHRLGDTLGDWALLFGVVLARDPLDLEYFHNGLAGIGLSDAEISVRAKRLLAAARPCEDAFRRHTRGEGRRIRALSYYVETHVNSKMVREGYSFDEGQAIADLIPLCELTPASRPLFLPFDAQRMKKPCSADEAAMCDAWAAEMNVRFRNFYNTLIPALYGSVWFI